MTTVRQKIDESWTRLMEVIDQAPGDRLEEPGACGDWSVKDLMAHMAYWDDRAVYVAETLSAGEEIDPIDWQEVNTQEAALRANWSLEESRKEMHLAHARLLDVVERDTSLDADTWAGNTYDHYDEHTVDVRNWLGETSS